MSKQPIAPELLNIDHPSEGEEYNAADHLLREMESGKEDGRTFSLNDMIECWNACANYWDQNRDNSKTSWYSKEYPNKENYFKDKFNIDLNP